ARAAAPTRRALAVPRQLRASAGSGGVPALARRELSAPGPRAPRGSRGRLAVRAPARGALAPPPARPPPPLVARRPPGAAARARLRLPGRVHAHQERVGCDARRAPGPSLSRPAPALRGRAPAPPAPLRLQRRRNGARVRARGIDPFVARAPVR